MRHVSMMCWMFCVVGVWACDSDECKPMSEYALHNLQAAPRANVIAEVLALSCSDDIVADPARYESLVADVEAIIAVDARMNIEPYSVLAYPASLGAYEDEEVASARAVLDSTTCAGRLTKALSGVASERTSTFTQRTRINVEFPMRLNEPVLLATYASLGVLFQPTSLAGDGSTVAYVDVSGGREFFFRLGGGDCLDGCTTWHNFWWRVEGGAVTLLGEWGRENGSSFGQQPETFEPAAFARCP